MFKKGLFIFRRDLRLRDNTALNEALTQCKEVSLLFIINPEQVTTENSYRSLNALQFMGEALKDLDIQTDNKLNFIYGSYEELKNFLEKDNFDAVFVNNDYTPYAIKRDLKIKELCTKKNIKFLGFNDAMLNCPDSVKKSQDGFYTVYTPYYKSASQIAVKKPITKTGNISKKVSLIDKEKWNKIFSYKNPNLFVHGTLENLHQLIKRINIIKDYKKNRDYPFEDQTTHLSAFLKFGLISPREAYWKLEHIQKYEIIRQLYWRDFYMQVAYHNPKVYKESFQEKYKDISWDFNQEKFDLWCNGNTGFPIVDAGMRQLNKTGYMHNRVRMIVASFLTKDLHISWQHGEKYFAQNLVDYDPAVNNGNWQWASSTGCDAAPYFRIFNPWLQQKKFDPEAKYIKEWVDELKKITTNEIHNYETNNLKILNYNRPIVDHKKESEKSKMLFKNI